jgi:hypothetical protein
MFLVTKRSPHFGQLQGVCICWPTCYGGNSSASGERSGRRLRASWTSGFSCVESIQFPGGITPAVDHRLFTAHPVTRLYIQVDKDFQNRDVQDRGLVNLGWADRGRKSASGTGWSSLSFRLWDLQRSLERPGTQKPYWTVACWGRQYYIIVRPEAQNGNSGQAVRSCSAAPANREQTPDSAAVRRCAGTPAQVSWQR